MSDIELLARFWNVKIPNELECYWKDAESFEGFCGDNQKGQYILFYSARDALKEFGMETKEFMPHGFLPLGGNGGGEFIVFSEDRGYGLLPAINGGADDFHFIANNLDEFWEKSKGGRWFG